MHFELDIQSFIKDFKLESSTVISALKTLEHEELLVFSEQVFVQPRLQVVCGRERMFEFEKEFPQLEPLLKTLLRTYEGVLDQPVNIDEKKLAFILKQSADDVIQGIDQMKIHGVVSYLPRKEKPQVYLLQNRVRSDDLRIDVKRYNQRKAQFDERVNAIINYVYDEKNCRSAIIGKYFGDEHIKNCGICDNCLRQKKMSLHSSEFGPLNEKIMTELQRNPVTLDQLVERMDGVSSDKINEMIRFLQEEEKITITTSGLIVMQT
jgi:ATP-dependent DNA helicase RecQ